MNKFEKLIEYIINDDEDRARALFHEIVVEKSREIYENIMDEEIGADETEDLVDDITDIETEEIGLGEADDDLDMEVGGDVDDMDDMGDDMEDMEDVGTEEEPEELEDRVMDLESALDELKAEFDALMADEEKEEEHEDMFADKGDEVEESLVREYVEKVADQGQKHEGGVAGHGGKASVNTKSAVAGKNDMGGTAANIAKGGAEQAPDGTTPKKAANYGTKGQGNMPHAGNFENVPGAKAALSSANKAKTGEETAVNKHSVEAGK